MRGAGEREAGGDSAGRQARHTPQSRRGPSRVTLRKATGDRAAGGWSRFHTIGLC